MNQSGAIPEIVPGGDLVTTINDRIRRINIALGLATQGAVGPRGPAGSSGTGGGSGTGGMVTVPNIANTFTIDFSSGATVFRVLLVANSTMKRPVNQTAGTQWRLIIDWDSTGGWLLTLDTTAFYFRADLFGAMAGSTRAQSHWICEDALGNNSLSGWPSTDQPIP